jgi:hypothetical protein
MTQFRELREHGRRRAGHVGKLTAETLPDPDLSIGVQRPAEKPKHTAVTLVLRVQCEYVLPDGAPDAVARNCARTAYGQLVSYTREHFMHYRPRLPEAE